MGTRAGRAWASTLSGFLVLPALSMAAAVLAIPVLVRQGGVDGWAAVAVAQGLGATAALVTTFGWGVVGPVEVAQSSADDQRHLYWVSGVMRGLLLAAALPCAVVLTVALVPPAHAVAAVAVCAATAAQGLSPTWFLVGQARPMALAAMETVPRTLGVLAAVVLVLVTEGLLAYGVTTLVVEAAIAGCGFVALGRRRRAAGDVRALLAQRFRAQWPLAVSAVVSAGYTRAAVPIVSGVDLRAVAVFAVLDRVQMLSRTALRPFVNFFQGWVARTPAPSRRRAVRATAVTGGVGALGGVLIAVVLPAVDHVVFGTQITVSPIQAALLAVAVAAVAATYSTGLYFLVPMGAVRVLSASTVVGSLAGVPLLLVLTREHGATGAVLAVAISELVVLVVQALFLLSSARRGPTGQ